MATTNEAAIRITGDASDLARALSRVENGLERLGRTASRAGGFLSNALSVAVGGVLSGGVNQALGVASALAGDFFSRMVDGTQQSVSAQLFLKSAIGETGGDLATAAAEAENFARALGLTVADSERLRATAAIGLAGTGADAGEFLDRAADLAAARGLEIGELGTIITQIFNGADEGLGKLFAGKNPSTFFKDFAQASGRTVDSLTDVERRTILVNAVMQAGATHAGEAGAKLTGLAGILTSINSLVTELAAKIGEALTRNVGVLGFVNSVKDALLNLITNQGAFDAFMQKLADGLVFAGGKALDFAAFVARGFNTAVGWIQKVGLEVEVLATRIAILVLTVFQNIVPLIARGIAALLEAVRPVVASLTDLLTSLLEGIVEKITSFTRNFSTTALNLLAPGAGDAARALEGASGGFEKARNVARSMDQTIGNAAAGLKDFGSFADSTGLGINALASRWASLNNEITAVDKQTAAASTATDAFFDSLRPGLAGFGQFNERAAVGPGAPVLTTRLIETEFGLTSVEVVTTAAEAAARAAAAAADTAKGASNSLEGKITVLADRVDDLTTELKNPKLAQVDITLAQGLHADPVIPAGNRPR